MSDAPATSSSSVSRRMKYPYTYTAKIAQFPWKFYFTNSWLYRYYLVGMVCSLPLFYKIHKAVNSPGNVALWEKKAREEAEENARHHH